ncbi:MAG: hypothetical protein AVDCRST_MAG86-3907 [uncultured Truepera sp.]|uniref:PKD domain-containing protein n=1 Tax=uncultured Truepera sp. TaxID=543023 RepID=A0A6J4VST0_9DEIN|nr:MAG: hypothetical protein AVDCRST_MAG86-3907 [uncultured Truepera sp.]
MTHSQAGLRFPWWSLAQFLALPLTLAACAGGGGGTPGTGEAASLRLSADTVQGEVPLVVSFTAVAEPAPNDLSYRWDFGLGEPSSGGRSRPYVYTEPGTYTASVALSQGGVSAQDEVVIEVAELSRAPDISNEPPVVTFTSTVPDPAAPYTVAFRTDATDPGDALAYLVDFGDGEGAVGASVSHTYAAPGSYLATVVVSDGRDEAVTAETVVTLK